MKRSSACSRILPAALLLLSAVHLEGFTFKAADMSLRVVLQAAALDADVGIVMDEGVQGNVAVDVQETNAIEFMTKLAQENGLALRKVDLGNGTDNYVVGSESILADFDKGMEKSAKLELAGAEKGPITVKTPNLAGSVLLGIIQKGMGKPIYGDYPMKTAAVSVKGVEPLKLLKAVAALNGASLAPATEDGKAGVELVPVTP